MLRGQKYKWHIALAVASEVWGGQVLWPKWSEHIEKSVNLLLHETGRMHQGKCLCLPFLPLFSCVSAVGYGQDTELDRPEGLALRSFMVLWRDEGSWVLHSGWQMKREAGGRYLQQLNRAAGGRQVWGVWTTLLVSQLEWILSYWLMNRPLVWFF